MIYNKFKNKLSTKGLIIDIDDDAFDKILQQYGFYNIVAHEYILPFLDISVQNLRSNTNGGWIPPYQLFLGNNFRIGTKFTDIINFFKLDIWFGNILTEVYHYVEIFLISKIENTMGTITINNQNPVDLMSTIDSNWNKLNNISFFKKLTNFVVTLAYANKKINNKSIFEIMDRLTYDGSIRLFKNLKYNIQNNIISQYGMNFLDSSGSSFQIDVDSFIYINDAVRWARNDSSHFTPIFSSKFSSGYTKTLDNQNSISAQTRILTFFSKLLNNTYLQWTDIEKFPILTGMEIIKKVFQLEQIIDPIITQLQEKLNNYFVTLNDTCRDVIKNFINDIMQTNW